MPRMMANEESMVVDIPGPGNFQFSAIRPDTLGGTEYTLVTIVCDITGSVSPFAKELRDCVISIVKGCKKHDRVENLMLRLVLFNTTVGVQEVHGFLNVSRIIPDDYEELLPDGGTPLYDATYSSIGATLKYAKTLTDKNFDVNGCVYIITDGDDNRSKLTPKYIAELTQQAVVGEDIESLITVLIGIFDPHNQQQAQYISGLLDKFHKEAQLTQYVDAGDATPQKLAKLANFVSESVSSQSQALGSSTASQPLTF